MQRVLIGSLTVLLLVSVGVGGVACKKDNPEPAAWPKQPVPWIQDLPPAGSATWPRPALAWGRYATNVDVAGPDGLLRPASLTCFTNSVGIKFARIEPGKFLMGLSDRQALRLGQSHLTGHLVTITKPFYLTVFETSNLEYELSDPEHKAKRPAYQQGPGGDAHPVESVTWQDAVKFCRWLSAKDGHFYRLPTEAEWEYACRAGTSNRFYWGDAPWDPNKANVGGLTPDHETWTEDGYEYTAPVGAYPPNPWGLHDMIGNVWEWCQDWHGPFSQDQVTDPKGPTRGYLRVYRGGNWSSRTRDLSAAIREGDDPTDIPTPRGFRIACEVE